MTRRAEAPALIEYGVATLTLPGEVQSGDLHLVKTVGGGVLVAVVDGLGHGADAASAARTAVAALDRHASDAVLPLLRRCHEALAETRGVVMSVAFLDRAHAAMTWIGVGNVEGVLLFGDAAARPPHASLITRGGIIGSELPELRAQTISITVGDVLILATDGVRTPFTDDLPADAEPQRLADHILSRHGKGTDDALVLVARYTGGGGARA